MGKLNDKIKSLEQQILDLQSKVEDLSRDLENKATTPHSKVGVGNPAKLVGDLNCGLSLNLIWNDSELQKPYADSVPETPTRGYNKHSHSQFSGGALDINTLELVEYEYDPSKQNKHCQQFFLELPKIKTVQNSKGEDIEKIGNMDITFDPNEGKWKAGISEIDVERINLVKKDESGLLEKDEDGNDMSAPLYSSDANKSNVVWDKTNKVWRFYGFYAD